ncbi:hypothetical protein BMF94_5307 [Rhodotorula taiwanensis]|uniref:C2H2-type domain-containing protein n=1 Tax=Rhodotorula taiwanensis TaxID=741276 RepID=A0A2S5B4B0_9BASI|nr:hypothetical protein BMF94_5307 [Rhodotorula taiwanensis]
MAHLHGSHWYCEPCDQIFKARASRRSHWANSKRHEDDYCGLCDKLLDACESLHEHEKDCHIGCRGCTQFFLSLEACHQHGRQVHPWCEVHKRAFQSQNNYEQHMRSAEHVGLHFPCPGANCGRKFRNRGDLTAHWEQGTCPSDINRTTIDYFIRANDKNRMITSGPPRQLLTDAASPIVYLATERSYSWTRQAYVCALCRSEHRTLHSLNQHLASPRHTHAGVGDGLKPYKCPAATCGRHFLTLSAVIRHAEQGVCPVLQSPPMSRALDDAFGGMRQLTCR